MLTIKKESVMEKEDINTRTPIYKYEFTSTVVSYEQLVRHSHVLMLNDNDDDVSGMISTGQLHIQIDNIFSN